MKLSLVISDGTFPCNTAPVQGSTREAFRAAAKAGFDAVQLTLMDPSEANAEELLSLCREYRLGISAIATGRIYGVLGCSLGTEDEEKRSEAVERMKRHIRFADALRISGAAPAVIVGAVRGRYRDASSPEAYYRAFHRSMEELFREAERLSVPAITEAIELSESEAYRDVRETAAYLRSFNSPLMKLQLDTMHMRRENQTAQAAAAEADLVWQVDLSGEARCRIADDDYDYGTLLSLMAEKGYDGYLTFEYVPVTEEQLSEDVALVRSYLR